MPPPNSPGRPGRPPGRFTQHHRMDVLENLLVQQPKGVTVSEIAAALHITPRSARRYLAQLKNKLEAVPERGSREKRWRIPSYDVPRKASIRRSQAYALLATRGLFEPLRGTALYEEIAIASRELLAVARRPGRGPNAGEPSRQLERRFQYVPFAPKDYADHAETFDTLYEAVAALKVVRCRYPDPNEGELERLRVHPYALLLYKDAVFFLGLDVARDCVRAFALHRVRDMRCLDDAFELPDDFRVDDYLQGQFGLARNDAPQEIVIDFGPEVADYLLTRRVHDSQRTARLEGGGVRVTLALSDLDEVATWLLGFGARAKVVSPPALADKVVAALRETLGRYGV